ncbi:NSUN4 isoform 6 [Pongo abelii]|uniref:NSUN4 isoform 6 n=1 Tax=Pongo abelii TaxID=9601 RepID=A0A2J8SLK3_PONAB|nr:NSUN4 isoform 6 [Pongo abelii]
MAALTLRGVRELLKRVNFATVPRRHRYKKKWPVLSLLGCHRAQIPCCSTGFAEF